MKSKYVILASALLISVATFAQKDQIKNAEKALKSGDTASKAVVNALQTVSPKSATYLIILKKFRKLLSPETSGVRSIKF